MTSEKDELLARNLELEEELSNMEVAMNDQVDKLREAEVQLQAEVQSLV